MKPETPNEMSEKPETRCATCGHTEIDHDCGCCLAHAFKPVPAPEAPGGMGEEEFEVSCSLLQGAYGVDRNAFVAEARRARAALAEKTEECERLTRLETESIATRNTEILRLRAALAQAERERHDFAEALKKAEEELATYMGYARGEMERLRRLAACPPVVTRELARAREQRDAAETKLKQAEEDFAAFRETAAELEQASANYFRRMNAAEAKLKKAEEENEQLTRIHDQKHALAYQYANEAHAAEAKLKKAEKERDAQVRHWTTLKQQRDAAEERVKTLEKIIEDAHALLERTRPDDSEHTHHLRVGCWPCDYATWKAAALKASK